MGERATLMDSFTEMTEILLPNDTNDLGRALGGVVLHWMDLCGAVAAMRFSTRHCVTAAMDNADFVGPTEPAEIAVIEWYVFDVGSSSMEVRAGDPREEERRTTTTSFFTYVALDEDGTPTTVPRLECPTESEAELRDAAREQRLEQLRQVQQKIGA
ncbi:acyl-CoA thioesterase [Halobacteriales archaeon QS_1_68_20]|nr:MAG: acyl-CoA thioesterase [Halobacteriales archaeon QS_1_68_20]